LGEEQPAYFNDEWTSEHMNNNMQLTDPSGEQINKSSIENSEGHLPSRDTSDAGLLTTSQIQQIEKSEGYLQSGNTLWRAIWQ